jgi:hypothetical protein
MKTLISIGDGRQVAGLILANTDDGFIEPDHGSQ